MTVANDLKAFQRRMVTFFGKSQSPKELKKTGEKAADLIRKRTRLGRGTTETTPGKPQRLKKLSPQYIEFRKSFNLGEAGKPNFSNLTLTGQMLKSLGVIKVKKGLIRVGPTGTRDDGNKNIKVAAWQRLQGRTFMHLTRGEERQLITDYRERLGLIVKKDLN